MIFQFSSLQKSIWNRCKTAFEKNSPKKLSKFDFLLHFASPNPPQIHPKSKKIASESELKKRLQRLNAAGARLNGLDPARQAQEAS